MRVACRPRCRPRRNQRRPRGCTQVARRLRQGTSMSLGRSRRREVLDDASGDRGILSKECEQDSHYDGRVGSRVERESSEEEVLVVVEVHGESDWSIARPAPGPSAAIWTAAGLSRFARAHARRATCARSGPRLPLIAAARAIVSACRVRGTRGFTHIRPLGAPQSGSVRGRRRAWPEGDRLCISCNTLILIAAQVARVTNGRCDPRLPVPSCGDALSSLAGGS
jgi:hypothetical protein